MERFDKHDGDDQLSSECYDNEGTLVQNPRRIMYARVTLKQTHCLVLLSNDNCNSVDLHVLVHNNICILSYYVQHQQQPARLLTTTELLYSEL